MSVELLYTSAPNGLKQGSRGFCTVLSTQGMPVNLASRLELLSGYRHIFPPQDAQANLNPVAWSHVSLTMAGHVTSILSRIAAYGVDYSGRTNKLAHHVVVGPSERIAAGPAWLLQSPGLMRSEWGGVCETPASGPPIVQANQTARVCETWKSLTGDAGWGGVVAEALVTPAGKPLWVIYRLDQQRALLELMNESIALLPESQRWQATFSTYYTNLPPEVDCKVRFVVEGTEEASKLASRGSSILLAPGIPLTIASAFVESARTGASITVPAPAAPATRPAAATTRPAATIDIESMWDEPENITLHRTSKVSLPSATSLPETPPAIATPPKFKGAVPPAISARQHKGSKAKIAAMVGVPLILLASVATAWAIFFKPKEVGIANARVLSSGSSKVGGVLPPAQSEMPAENNSEPNATGASGSERESGSTADSVEPDKAQSDAANATQPASDSNVTSPGMDSLDGHTNGDAKPGGMDEVTAPDANEAGTTAPPTKDSSISSKGIEGNNEIELSERGSLLSSGALPEEESPPQEVEITFAVKVKPEKLDFKKNAVSFSASSEEKFEYRLNFSESKNASDRPESLWLLSENANDVSSLLFKEENISTSTHYFVCRKEGNKPLGDMAIGISKTQEKLVLCVSATSLDAGKESPLKAIHGALKELQSEYFVLHQLANATLKKNTEFKSSREVDPKYFPDQMSSAFKASHLLKYHSAISLINESWKEKVDAKRSLESGVPVNQKEVFNAQLQSFERYASEINKLADKSKRCVELTRQLKNATLIELGTLDLRTINSTGEVVMTKVKLRAKVELDLSEPSKEAK